MKKRFNKNSFSKGPKNLIFVALFFVVSIGLLILYTDFTRHVKTMSYSSFLKSVEADQVKSVHLAGNEMHGLLKSGDHFETMILNTPEELELLKNHNVEISLSHPSTQLSFWHILLLSFFLLIPFSLWYFFRQSRGHGGGGGNNIFSMGKSKARMSRPSSIKVNFDSVAGAQDAKEELKDIIDFLKNPEKYKRLGAKIPKGILLIGEPGNGKTLLAKAVAGEANCPFFSITGSDFIEVFVGVGAARVRDLFSRARKHAPAIVFIDEIDAIGRQRGSGFGGGHDEREQTLNQLLTEMDGFDSNNSPVIVVAATNMPEVLDKALLRPGRFDRRVNVPFPDTESRKKILEIHSGSLQLSSDVNLDEIANKTAGFSGADLANLMNKAAITASKNNHEKVMMADMEAAYKSLIDSQDNVGNLSNPMTKSNSNAKMFMPNQVKTTFADVAGLYEAKEEVQDFVNFLKNPEKYQRLGAKIAKGVLLIGDPGNGKTLLARAVAGEANRPFFNVSASEFVEMYVGVGASRVRDLFTQAKKHAPCIIFIDELDAVGGHRMGGAGGHEERNQTLNQLLTEMDGFQPQEKPIIVMAATNRVDSLDRALLRAGRFGRHVHVPYPDLKTREEILKLHCDKIKLDESVDLSKVARGTPGFSSAALAGLVNEATLIATKDPEKELVGIDDFEEARDKICIGKKSRTMMLTVEDKKMTAWHESGHALVRLLLPERCEPLHKLTIIPRGRALGVTHFLPEREKYSQSKEEMLGEIMSALGGRVAEELEFNLIGTGASNDFEKATQIARHMVRYYGMSGMGLAVYKENDKYSPQTAERIDKEVERILKDCYDEAKALLLANKAKLDMLATALLDKETLFADEIYELLNISPRKTFKFS